MNMRKGILIMENSFNTVETITPVLQQKYNRKERRKIYGGKNFKIKSKAPRNIASRKILPMPINWDGWKNWKPKKKVV